MQDPNVPEDKALPDPSDDDQSDDDQDWPDQTPPPHPRTITGPAHAATLITALMKTADSANTLAGQYLEDNDLYLAAASIECAGLYLHVAGPIIGEYAQDELAFAVFEKAQDDLTALQNGIIHNAGEFPLYQDTVSCLRVHQQALLNLGQLEIIQDVLKTQGKGLDDWNDEKHEAHISTAQFFGYQPPFSDTDGLPEPRPALAEEANAARSRAEEIADGIMEAYMAHLPVHISPMVAALPDFPVTRPEAPLSPAFPRFGVHFQEETGGPPTPYMTFIYGKAIHIKTINEPYPKGFPQQLATDYVETAAQAILDPALGESGLTDDDDIHLSIMVDNMLGAVELGLHTVDLRAIVQAAKDAGLPRGARTTVIEALTDLDDDLADSLLQDPGSTWRKRVTKKQALSVLHAARLVNTDTHTMGKLAFAMGYEMDEVGITIPGLTRGQFSALMAAVEKTGLPESSATRIIEALL